MLKSMSPLFAWLYSSGATCATNSGRKPVRTPWKANAGFPPHPNLPTVLVTAGTLVGLESEASYSL